MKKFTLLLGLTLLWGGTNVVAQNVSTYEDLAKEVAGAKKKADAAVDAQKEYDAALASYNNWAGRDTMVSTTVTIGANAEYQTFYNVINGASKDKTIKIYSVLIPGKRSSQNTVAFATSAVKDKLLAEDPDGLWKNATEMTSSALVDNNETTLDSWTSEGIEKYAKATIYCLESDAKTVTPVIYISTASFKEGAFFDEIFQAAWEAKRSEIPLTTTEQTVNSAYTTAKENLATAQQNLTTANAALSCTITLDGNITNFGVSDPADAIVWPNELPSNCTLEGNGYSINSSSALFEINKGTIKNVANANGLIATQNEGKINYCLEKRNATTYRTYISNTNYEDHKNVSIEEVIAGLSGFSFGYDVQDGTIAPGMALYQAYYASAANKTLYSFYVNVVENEVKLNADAFTAATTVEAKNMCINEILYIDANVSVTADNVATKKGGVYTAANVVLTETKEFYIPMNVKASSLSYDRTFIEGYSSVCLPFTVSAVSNVAAYNFYSISADNTTMNFRAVSAPVANKPYLIKTNGGEVFKSVKNVDLVATPAQLQTEVGDVDFNGVYKYTQVSDLVQNDDYAVYGISKGKLVLAESNPNKSDYLNPFRSYVYCKALTAAVAGDAPAYKIGLLEEDEIETGIETVATDDAEGLGVKGGENAVEITTDKACKVNVYTMNGMLVKSETVEAGTTALPLKAGMYVVNGVKVIVK